MKVHALIETLSPSKFGRPLLLCEINAQVCKHIQAIRAADGVINNHIVIATVRGIIQMKDRSLSTENGGHIELSRLWSNSILHHLGYGKRKETRPAKIARKF